MEVSQRLLATLKKASSKGQYHSNTKANSKRKRKALTSSIKKK